MKKIFYLLLSVSIISFLYTFTFIIKESLDYTIPDIKESITIETYDANSPKYVYDFIQKYAVEHDIDIHKIVFSTSEKGEPEKKIFSFLSSEKKNYSYPSNFFKSKVEFYNRSDIIYENPIGTYATTKRTPKNLVYDFEKMGISVSVEKHGMIDFIYIMFLSPFGILSTILLFITIISSIFYSFSTLKKIGILEIMGKSTFPLLVNDVLFILLSVTLVSLFFSIKNNILILYYIFIAITLILFFTLFLLVSRGFIISLISTVNKINGKKGYDFTLKVSIFLKLITFSIFIIISFNLIANVNVSKNLQTKMASWKTNDPYYRLLFSNSTTFFDDDKRENSNTRLLPLITLAENNESILFEKVLEDNGNVDNQVNILSNFISVNSNYVNSFPIYDNKEKIIGNLSPDKFYCLIPEKFAHMTDKISDEARKEIAFNFDVTGEKLSYYNDELEIISIKDNQSILDLNSENMSNTEYLNSILLVVSINSIKPNIEKLLAEVSQGNYLFQNPEKIMNFISKNNMNSEFFGLTSQTDLALEQLAKINQEITINMMVLTFIVAIFILLQFFVCWSYIEVNKKRNFLEYLFGKSYIQRHGKFIFSMSALSIVISIIFLIFNFEFLKIALVGVLVEFIIIIIAISVSEKNKRFAIIKKEV